MEADVYLGSDPKKHRKFRKYSRAGKGAPEGALTNGFPLTFKMSKLRP